MPVADFLLHDFLSWRISGSGSRFEKFRKEFKYYQTDRPVENPDIVISLGDFPYSPPPGAILADKKFWVGPDEVFAHDNYKVAKWKVALSGLEKGPTNIRLWGNLPTNVIAARWFCETVIRVRMTLAGRPMVHSSCLSDGENGYVLAASPSTGKTTTLLSWLAKGNPFCSDEYSILDRGRVWSYVTPFRFHAHNLEMNPILKTLPAMDKAQIRLRTWLLKATGGYADVTWDIGLTDSLPQIPIVDHCKLSGLFVLTRAEVKTVEPVSRPLSQIITMLQKINAFELRGFGPYLRAYGFAHPASRIAEFAREENAALESVLKGVPVAELRIPSKYRPETYAELVEKVKAIAG